MPAFTKNPGRLLSLVLWLISAHSFFVGLMLIIQPAECMSLAGFGHNNERFFPTQGGVFHIVMAVCYAMAAAHINRYHYLIVFSIIVKIIATVFLLIYFLAVDMKYVVLLSGIGDGLMAIAMYLSLHFYLKYRDCKT